MRNVFKHQVSFFEQMDFHLADRFSGIIVKLSDVVTDDRFVRRLPVLILLFGSVRLEVHLNLCFERC